MVQLAVRRAAEGGQAEWLLLELQGQLEARGGGGGGLAGRLLGDLHFTQEGAPVLLVGHHVLYGKAVRLEKAVAVLRRGVAAPEDPRGPAAYEVAALIRTKLLFKTRPKPIVPSAPKKA
ncbi:chromosome transmission fidelity protein 8 homolog isoform X2 [Thamnophis elegans]|uniref:chromosome transmission fidelity protein 8 homolog isoform X2 n=1 Tax=Thamnophis elegans TaxID=35005 RepID=UPI0013777D9F|nr:chromosome transmission fidelity protein 8 homolog isoform X2 [Thamnophis elegans]